MGAFVAIVIIFGIPILIGVLLFRRAKKHKKERKQIIEDNHKNPDILESLYTDTEMLNVFKDKIVISEFRTTTKGTRTFFISQISGVQFKKTSALDAFGYLYFNLPGGKQISLNHIQNTSNENAVLFHEDLNGAAEKVKNKIDELITSHNSIPVENAANTSEADELTKFKKLLDDGVITQEEFEKKKQQLLNI